MLDAQQLTGRARSHVREIKELGCALHADVIAPFMRLRAAAALDGIDLALASGFRDFERQRTIWNGKYSGERSMQDRTGQPLAVATLSPTERVEAILWWSALPGASRHHWGADCDVYDRAALPAGRVLRLEPAEYAPDGPFAKLDIWLARNAAEHGFFKPYVTRGDGVSPEPWHLSYAPIAERCVSALTVGLLAETLRDAATQKEGVGGVDQVLSMLTDLHRRYVATYDAPPPNLKF